MAVFLLAACGSSEDGDEEEVVAEKTEENNDENEDSNGDESNHDDVNSEVMNLGETGYVDDGISQYEITPKSFEVFKERNGISVNNDDEVFVLIDYTIKNISDEG